MDIIRAREIVRTLIDGVDPTTGELLPYDSPYNAPEVIRALLKVWEVTAPRERKRAKPRNAGKPWPEIEDDKLRDEYASGMRISDIAREHGRTFGAIESRLDHLGLRKKSYFWFFKRKK